nr:hypothetical protein Iba_chr14aCG12990 [Ipomoea batatas]GMD90352.1 hypothetical protein Iba_chr14dCG8840 [Ipomoea batatas]GMD92641.1 hypothetical protein Iba_chr14eCG11070 [Ipomoea batatas]
MMLLYIHYIVFGRTVLLLPLGRLLLTLTLQFAQLIRSTTYDACIYTPCINY